MQGTVADSLDSSEDDVFEGRSYLTNSQKNYNINSNKLFKEKKSTESSDIGPGSKARKVKTFIKSGSNVFQNFSVPVSIQNNSKGSDSTNLNVLKKPGGLCADNYSRQTLFSYTPFNRGSVKCEEKINWPQMQNGNDDTQDISSDCAIMGKFFFFT